MLHISSTGVLKQSLTLKLHVSAIQSNPPDNVKTSNLKLGVVANDRGHIHSYYKHLKNWLLPISEATNREQTEAWPSSKSAAHQISHKMYRNRAPAFGKKLVPDTHTPAYHTPAYRHTVLDRTVTHNFKTGLKNMNSWSLWRKVSYTLAKAALGSRNTGQIWRQCNRPVLYTSLTANPQILWAKSSLRHSLFSPPPPPRPQYQFN